MIAYAAAQHLDKAHQAGGFTVKPRWALNTAFQAGHIKHSSATLGVKER